MLTKIMGLADLFNFVRDAYFSRRVLVLPGLPELPELVALVERIILVRPTEAVDKSTEGQWIAVPLIVALLALKLDCTVTCSAADKLTEATMYKQVQQLVYAGYDVPIPHIWGLGSLRFYIDRKTAQLCIDYAVVVWHMPNLKII